VGAGKAPNPMRTDNWLVARGVRPKRSGLGGSWVVRVLLVVTAIAVFFLVLSRGTTTAGQGGDGRRGTGQNQPLQEGRPPPDISGLAFDGSPVRLSSLRGKVVLVNFFASWCAECRAEIPDIERAYRARRTSGFEVVGVNAWENGDGRAFLRELGGTYAAVADPQPAPNRPGAIASSYGLDTQALPVSVFVARDGNVHRVFPGRIDRQNIDAELGQMGIR
jgi:peroxiredoxin